MFVSCLFHVGVRLRGRSAARKRALKLLIQNICLGFKGGMPATLNACLITYRSQRATQWAAEARCGFGSSRRPFTYHSSSLPAAQLQPDLPLLPLSTVPPSASHTVDSTNNRLLSMHTHTRYKNTQQRRWTFAGTSTQEIRRPSLARYVCQRRSFT